MDYENEKSNFLNENIPIKKYRNCFEKTIKHNKLNIGKPAILRILFCLLVLIIILFRGHFLCLLGFLNCYITWPFTSPLHVKIDLLNLSNEPKGHEYIPRRIHHILLGPLSSTPPESWISARNSCIAIHSKFEKHYYWTDENGQEFLEKYYPWFVKIWNSYKTNIQKADALRYFVLHHYGGIFLDMDLYCLHQLDGLLNYLDNRVSTDEHIFLAVKAFPVGISNGFIITTRNHPLLKRVIENLELYNRNFVLPHATIVISTGPMYISIQIQLNRSLWSSILVLDGKENMIGGKTNTPLFRHLGSGSWHKADDMFFKNIPMNIQHQNQTFSISIIVFIIFIFVFFIGRNKNFLKVNLFTFELCISFLFLFFLNRT
jgi:mannosyltransferase OCH1-like enzyme